MLEKLNINYPAHPNEKPCRFPPWSPE